MKPFWSAITSLKVPKPINTYRISIHGDQQMAQLSSPGVAVTVIDESFYTPAAPGTTPLIIVASAESKQNGAGTGTAPGTLAANAGNVYLLTSQKDLSDTFGTPVFKTDANNNPVHAGEQNEYGLQAAYSYLGVSNRAYVVRADIDLAQLDPLADAPAGMPDDGTFWFDTANTKFGIFEWNAAPASVTGGQTFTVKYPLVVNDTAKVDAQTGAPKASLGAIGDYAIVAVSTLNVLWYKKAATDTPGGVWVDVGGPEWTASWPTASGTISSPDLSNADTFTINNTLIANPSNIADLASKINTAAIDGVTAAVINGKLELFSTGVDITIVGALAGDVGLAEKTYKAPQLAMQSHTQIPSFKITDFDKTVVANGRATGSVWVKTTQPNLGARWIVKRYNSATSAWEEKAAPLYPTNQAALAGIDPTGGGINLGLGQLYVQYNTAEETPAYANFKLFVRTGVGATKVSTTSMKTMVAGDDIRFTISESLKDGTMTAPQQIEFVTAGDGTDGETLSNRINAAGFTYIIADYDPATGIVTISHKNGGDFRIVDNDAGQSGVAAVALGAQGHDYSAGLRVSVTAPDLAHGTQAVITPVVASGVITNYLITNAGNGYTTAPTVTLVKPATGTATGTGAGTTSTITLSTIPTNPIYVGMVVTNGGSGIQANTKVTGVTGSGASQTISLSLPLTSSVSGTLTFTDTGSAANPGTVTLTDPAEKFTLGTLIAGASNLYPDPSDANNAHKYVASLWAETIGGSGFAVPSAHAPSTISMDGQLWYNSMIDEVDIMIHNGTHWVGYLNYTQNQVGGTTTDPAGPIVSASKPTVQSDGTALANGDLWIDTSDLENFPRLYKYNYLTKKWILVDNSDQSTEEGILFHDARWTTAAAKGNADASTIAELLSDNFLDFDAPDPALYPKGMLLWNLRRSGFNVKRFVRNYVDILADNHRYNSGESMSEYYPHRWVSEAANNEDGSGCFGHKAQRKVVIQKLQALVNSNQQIRDEESRVFNLIATPGYPELVGEMVSLNYDRGLTAFVVADTPARLHPDATTLSNWGNNVNGALEDNDLGLVSSDEYLAFFYPWGYTSDNIGNNIAVPPSHMILRTIALSDNVSYPWFAPAGTRRGGITNATAVGYITSEGEFKSVALNNGQRDTLASVKVNPITFITGTGLVNYGQYTRAKNASALDRINVARLVVYLRRQFAQLAKPYVFEPNDKITRDEIKGAAESLLLELVGQRALYDYLVVCDTSNNTPARIDRNELYLDVAIEPVKAVEFIYIPLRLKNTGEIKGLG